MISIILCSIIITSCALSEDNPLHNKKAPSVINNDDWSATNESGAILIEWTPFDISDCDGYYIYRSLSQNGQYVNLVEIDNNYDLDAEGKPNDIPFRDFDILTGNYYYYKISGYKEYGEYKLEGKISEPKGVRAN